MLVEKLLKSNKKIKQALQKIDKKLDAIIIGDIDAAGTFLQKVLSPDFDAGEKRIAINNAIHQLEIGHARLGYLPAFCKLRSEVAAQIGVCYWILEKNIQAKQWFTQSKNELKKLITIPAKEIYGYEEGAVKLANEIENKIFQKAEFKTTDSLTVTTAKIVLLPILGGFVYIPSTLAFLSTIPLSNNRRTKEEYNLKLKSHKKEAAELLAEIQKVFSTI